MKKIIALLALMIALPVLANPKYLIICVQEDLAAAQREEGRAKIMEYFGDATEISFGNMPRYYKLTPSSNNWRIACFPINVGTVVKTNLNISYGYEYVTSNFPASETGKVMFLEGSITPSADIDTAGFVKYYTEVPL